MNRLGLSMALLVLLAILGVSALGFNTIENGTTAPSKGGFLLHYSLKVSPGMNMTSFIMGASVAD